MSKLDLTTQISNLCISLDPDPELIHMWDIVRFCGEIIDATQDLVCAYKFGPAFFMAAGEASRIGNAMAEVPAHIPCIYDGKFCDIGNTASMYADYVWNHVKADACTVVPYFGSDGVAPLIQDDKLTFIVAASSNPSGTVVQESVSPRNNQTVYRNVMRTPTIGDSRVGFVAPATKLETLKDIRLLAPNQWLLVPGLGAQGGDLKNAVEIAGKKALYVVGRSILYPHNKDSRFYASEVRMRARYFRDAINNAAST
jgi:orotidine-5'-phosphate decarboxylase